KRHARIEIDDVTADGFSMNTFTQEGAKEEVAEGAKKKTYDEHIDGLLKRLKGATQSQVELEVPAGKFTCQCYTKESGDDKSHSTEKYWLSSSVPGMFIKAEHSVSADKQTDFETWTLTDLDILRAKLPWTNKEIAAAWKDGAVFKFNITAEGGAG